MDGECTNTRDRVRQVGARRLLSFPDATVRGANDPTVSQPVRLRVVNFDPHRRAASPELKAAIKRLGIFLTRRELDLGLRQRRRSPSAHESFKLAVEVLTCNLGGLCMFTPPPLLAVPRHSGAMWGNKRYRSPVYGQHFRDVLDLMAHSDIGFIEDVVRGYGFAGSTPRRSLVRLRGGLFRHVQPAYFNWHGFRRAEEPEVLILRGHKDQQTGRAEALDYPETRETRRLRAQVRRINDHLRKAPIFVEADGAMETDDGQPVDPGRRTIRRIFNNGSWEQGGRLYGAYWETMRREDRFRLMRIGTRSCPDGERIANVDYGQLYPRLAYLEAGQVPPEGDLYDIAGDGSNREGWKKLVNALLLSDRAFRHWPERTSEEFPPGTALRDCIAAIRQHHAPIAHLLGSGAGIKLMLKESEMLIATLLQLFRRGITALPLHDSVLTAISDAPDAEETMRAVFADRTGGASVSIKTTVSYGC